MKKALYRAFRPRTFDEVLGQDHITRVLKNQVKTGRPGHAYLFAGSRGTGKTSSAKIFARAINCLNPVDGNPCNECANCKAILNETSLDVVEMDAASNRRIDDIRELRDKVLYPPAQLKYKVYIIDEAHMITMEAFNALLKIMEEPPAHLIFILATTDPQQIPVTILSRTQRYEFRRLDISSIEKNLLQIGQKVDIAIEPPALHALALAADGSMRDGLSLLDQLLASGTKKIREEDVEEVLGTVGYEAVAGISRAILSNQRREVLAISNQLLLEGKDAHVLLRELIDYFRFLLLVKALGPEDARLPVDALQKKTMEELAGLSSMERISDSIELLIEGELLIRKADFAEAILQSTLVRLVEYIPKKNWLSRLEAVEAKLLKIQREGLGEKSQKLAEEEKKEDPLPEEPLKGPEPEKVIKEEPQKEPMEPAPAKEKEEAPPKKDREKIQSWFLENRKDLAKEAGARAIAPGAFFEKIEEASLEGEDLFLILSDDSQGKLVLKLIQAHEEDLSLLFGERLGKEVRAHVMGREEWSNRAKASLPPSRLEEADPEKRIREVFPPDLLDVKP